MCFHTEHKMGETCDNYEWKPSKSSEFCLLLVRWGSWTHNPFKEDWKQLSCLAAPASIMSVTQSQIHSEKMMNSLRVLCSGTCYKEAVLLFGRFTWNKLLQETTDEAVTNILGAWQPGIEFSGSTNMPPMEWESDSKKSRNIPKVSLSILKNLSSLGRELRHCYLHNGAGDASDAGKLLRESHLLWSCQPEAP